VACDEFNEHGEDCAVAGFLVSDDGGVCRWVGRGGRWDLGVAVAVLPVVDQIASGGLASIADDVGFWREGASGRHVGEVASTCEAEQRFVCGDPRDFDSEAPVKGEEVVNSLEREKGWPGCGPGLRAALIR
jgi:hypothetical protein